MDILLVSSFQEVFLLKDSKLRFRLCGRIVGYRPQLEPIYMSPEVRSPEKNFQYVNEHNHRPRRTFTIFISWLHKDNRSM